MPASPTASASGRSVPTSTSAFSGMPASPAGSKTRYVEVESPRGSASGASRRLTSEEQEQHQQRTMRGKSHWPARTGNRFSRPDIDPAGKTGHRDQYGQPVSPGSSACGKRSTGSARRGRARGRDQRPLPTSRSKAAVEHRRIHCFRETAPVRDSASRITGRVQVLAVAGVASRVSRAEDGAAFLGKPAREGVVQPDKSVLNKSVELCVAECAH